MKECWTCKYQIVGWLLTKKTNPKCLDCKSSTLSNYKAKGHEIVKKKRDKILVLKLWHLMEIYYKLPLIRQEHLQEEINDDIKDGKLQPIDPIFNRYGRYYNRTKKICWMETPLGAFKYDSPKNFIVALEFTKLPCLTKEEVKAIIFLINRGILGKKEAHLVHRNNVRLSIHATRHRSFLWRKKVLGY